ncbi:hypothetical protein SO694_00016367 [Aureococcus anophagefferens]|uniref:Uncharacterized protein n=1 Tax=Aureococcus anophagefferens TaxID=44056 RepID=A0ABR1G2E3_AURAN
MTTRSSDDTTNEGFPAPAFAASTTAANVARVAAVALLAFATQSSRKMAVARHAYVNGRPPLPVDCDVPTAKPSRTAAVVGPSSSATGTSGGSGGDAAAADAFAGESSRASETRAVTDRASDQEQFAAAAPAKSRSEAQPKSAPVASEAWSVGASKATTTSAPVDENAARATAGAAGTAPRARSAAQGVAVGAALGAAVVGARSARRDGPRSGPRPAASAPASARSSVSATAWPRAASSTVKPSAFAMAMIVA